MLAAAIEELAVGNMAPIGAVTLNAYAARYLAKLTTRTADEDRSRWRRHLEGSELASWPIADIKRRHIRDFMAALACKRKLVSTSGAGARSGGKVEGKETLSAQTQKHVFELLRRIFNEAKVDDIVEHNPCDGVRVNKAPEATQEKWSFLTLEEFDRLLRCPRLPEGKQFDIRSGHLHRHAAGRALGAALARPRPGWGAPHLHLSAELPEVNQGQPDAALPAPSRCGFHASQGARAGRGCEPRCAGVSW